MDYFTDVLAMFLWIDCGNIIAIYGGSESSQIPSKISWWTKVLSPEHTKPMVGWLSFLSVFHTVVWSWSSSAFLGGLIRHVESASELISQSGHLIILNWRSFKVNQCTRKVKLTLLPFVVIVWCDWQTALGEFIYWTTLLPSSSAEMPLQGESKKNKKRCAQTNQ